MTLGDSIQQVRYLGRITSSSVADSSITTALNNGMHIFAEKVHGIPTHSYITLTPRFDVQTNFAFRLVTNSASASFAFSSVSLASATGGTVAGKIQTQLQVTWGSATVSWSTTTWHYTITIPGATSIEIASPTKISYVDAVPLIFGAGSTSTASTWTSTFAEGCTMESALPSDYLSMDNVTWDIWPLNEAPFDIFQRPQYTGVPEWYFVRGKKIRIYPVPTSQAWLRINYKGLVTDFGTTTTTASPLPTEYQMAPVYYAVSELAEGTPDSTLANRFLQRFTDLVRDYTVHTANQSPQVSTFRPKTAINPAFKVGSLNGSS